jgi:uncharacterized protein
MDITPLIPEAHYVINSYGEGGFVVNKQDHNGPIVIFPEAIEAWDVNVFEDIDEASLAPIIAKADVLDVVLIGTGETQQFPSQELRFALKKHGINAEFMDTGAACRTYNVLLSEGRRMAAALLAI